MLPTEKLFGSVWIISWILAIWIYHIQFFLTGLFCLILAILILHDFDETNEKGESQLPTFFSMDKSTRTLTVQKIYENNLRWKDSEICLGNATLPSGAVKVGDVITDCSGNVALRHIPTNTIIGAYNFE